MLKTKKIDVTIAGCVRSGGDQLPLALENLDLLKKLFRSVKTVIVENDSTDNTKQILKEYGARSPEKTFIICLDGKISTSLARTERIAQARNHYLDFLRFTPDWRTEFLIVADLDEPLTSPQFIPGLWEAINRLVNDTKIAALFANANPKYYDIWALRCDNWVDSDCWHEVRCLQAAGIKSDEAVAKAIKSKQCNISSDAPLIAVRSAFGGLGIYRTEHALQSRYIGRSYQGKEICEHVMFNTYINDFLGGHMFIQPSLMICAPNEHFHESTMPSMQ